jgi:hypothetical protein
MSASLVPICTRMRSGIDELVVDGESGLLVGDRADAFLDAVRRLNSSKELWMKLSAGARAATLPFGEERCADQWAALIARVSAGELAGAADRLPAQIAMPRDHPEFKWEIEHRNGLPQHLTRLRSSLRGRLGGIRRRFTKSNGT